jgi:hypothetical protein
MNYSEKTAKERVLEKFFDAYPHQASTGFIRILTNQVEGSLGFGVTENKAWEGALLGGAFR